MLILFPSLPELVCGYGPLRGGDKVKMKLPHTNKDRVLRSPFSMAVNLWSHIETGPIKN